MVKTYTKNTFWLLPKCIICLECLQSPQFTSNITHDTGNELAREFCVNGQCCVAVVTTIEGHHPQWHLNIQGIRRRTLGVQIGTSSRGQFEVHTHTRAQAHNTPCSKHVYLLDAVV